MKKLYRGWYYYAVAGVLLATQTAKCHAQLYTWNNPAGGAFNSPGNWSLNGLPPTARVYSPPGAPPF